MREHDVQKMVSEFIPVNDGCDVKDEDVDLAIVFAKIAYHSNHSTFSVHQLISKMLIFKKPLFETSIQITSSELWSFAQPIVCNRSFPCRRSL